MIDEFLSSQIKAGNFPGACYLIAKGERVLKKNCIGFSVIEPVKIKATINTIYDIASLTKPLIIGSLYGLFFQNRILKFDYKLGKFYSSIPEEKKSIKIIELLTHQGGFPAWYPLYLEGKNKKEMIDFILNKLLLEAKPGKKVIYSCIGYILLGDILEKITGKSLNELAKEFLFNPLKLKNTYFNPPGNIRNQIAPTERGNKYEKERCGSKGENYNGWRKTIIWGEVHDHNCYSMGGISGNSGLFSNIEDLHCLALQFLKDYSILFKSEIIDLFYTNYTSYSTEYRSIGWKLASSRVSSAGDNFSRKSIGHTGFTGTSLWIDAEKKGIFIFLTNRIHPEYRDINFNNIRKKFHNLAEKVIFKM
ncbi:serine hydrolase [Candidatus Aminicenantes bacterium AC-708-M15]|jgi:CubicO group peptidase (beta-lactamase class C family)|nr:serine hydrolase [SCandidatus Aminicenantes bacterium Aminicenantia_JdfR_composite]MCP2597961.1 serine hydrolase [Candidatus Aminicenantes bacterium AC-335-L06]MCP2604241.1 serine hydrolase [Candidatus Aminicenantes bacterium AC-708-M15]MCP2606446.1 serine hydrolase [Candidatus Aminicenantes bacterium AC-708-I09]MCP2618164.1 serine hydrolase [Candidatus Aminicenantes bacterium AC-335-A11]